MIIYLQSFILSILSLLGCLYIVNNIDINGMYKYVAIITFIISIVGSFIILNKKYGFNNYTIGFFIIIYVLLLISIKDIQERIIPLDLIILGMLFGVILLIYNPNIKMLDVFISIVGIGGFNLIISKATKGGIGEGDILVFILIGIILGWKMALAIILYTFIIAGLSGIILLILKKANKKTELPLAPFILTATLFIIII